MIFSQKSSLHFDSFNYRLFKMTKLLFLSAFSLILLSSCNSTKSSDLNLDSSKMVEATIFKIFDACKSKNFKELESYHINDERFSIFKENGSKERLDAQQNQKIVEEELSALEDLNFDISDLKIDVVGNTAVASFIMDVKASYQDTPIAATNRTTFVFVEDGGVWKVLHEHFSPVAND